MIRIRNSRQYQDALARVETLEQRRAESFGSMLSQKDMNELLALGYALDTYELAHAEPRDRSHYSR